MKEIDKKFIEKVIHMASGFSQFDYNENIKKFNNQYNLRYLGRFLQRIDRIIYEFHQFNYTNNIHELFNNDLNVLIEL